MKYLTFAVVVLAFALGFMTSHYTCHREITVETIRDTLTVTRIVYRDAPGELLPHPHGSGIPGIIEPEVNTEPGILVPESEVKNPQIPVEAMFFYAARLDTTLGAFGKLRVTHYYPPRNTWDLDFDPAPPKVIKLTEFKPMPPPFYKKPEILVPVAIVLGIVIGANI